MHEADEPQQGFVFGGLSPLSVIFSTLPTQLV